MYHQQDSWYAVKMHPAYRSWVRPLKMGYYLKKKHPKCVLKQDLALLYTWKSIMLGSQESNSTFNWRKCKKHPFKLCFFLWDDWKFNCLLSSVVFSCCTNAVYCPELNFNSFMPLAASNLPQKRIVVDTNHIYLWLWSCVVSFNLWFCFPIL